MAMRDMNEIREGEQEAVDLLWHQKSLASIRTLITQGDLDEAKELQKSIGWLCREIEDAHGSLQHVTIDGDFELGMLVGKVSALRWVLGYDWDFLDC